MVTYSAVTIANFFVELANKTGTSITPMKLLKLVYLANGWHLGIFGNPLFTEPIQAWQYGPVIPSVYHAFKIYGGNDISQTSPNKDESITDEDKKLLLAVWDKYKHLTAWQLSELTHQDNTPWSEAWNTGNNSISPESIKLFYSQFLN